MSADLRRVEQERDTLREVAQGNERHVADLTVAYEAIQQERDEALRQRDEFVAAADKLHDSWLALKAELASARTELDAVRTARDNLDHELHAARKRIAELTNTEGGSPE